MISFGSMFNPERVSGRYAELGLNNPEYNIEGLKNDAERPKDFPVFQNESIGRSQVKTNNLKNLNPKKLELSDEDKVFISKLNSKMYGFHSNSNDFWVRSIKPVQAGVPNIILGDGKIVNGSSRQEFVKNLINDDTQAFQIAGQDIYGGNKLITVVNNNETGITTMYTCDSKECYPVAIDCKDIKLLKSAIIDNLSAVQGATVWSK